LPDKPSEGTVLAQTDTEPLPGQTCPKELASGQSFNVGSAHAGSAPGLSSETQENNDNNTNDDDFTDLNISSLPNQSTTSPAQ
jgi:hypothetical protein